MKETELYDYVNNFSVGYGSIDVDDILDIHKKLMKRNTIQNNVWIN